MQMYWVMSDTTSRGRECPIIVEINDARKTEERKKSLWVFYCLVSMCSSNCLLSDVQLCATLTCLNDNNNNNNDDNSNNNAQQPQQQRQQ